MRNPLILRNFLLLGVSLLALNARADDAASMLSKADQAFAAADYQTAMDIWSKLDGQLSPEQATVIKERTRFATRQLALMKERGITPATQPAQVSAPATQPARVAHVKPKQGEVVEMGLHDLGNFDFDESKDSVIPDDVKALSGSTLRITGQMIPLDQVGKVSRFILVNDLMSCCFGVAPKVQNVVYVTLPEGKWVESTSERIMIEGVLKVEVRKEDGYVLSLFELSPKSVKYAPQ